MTKSVRCSGTRGKDGVLTLKEVVSDAGKQTVNPR